MMPVKCLVVVPTYNEAGNILRLIKEDLKVAQNLDILVVDDNSPDNTGDLVERAIPEFKGRVHLMRRAGKLGLGTAYIAGFEWGLARGYDVFIEQDADFSHTPHYIRDMLREVENGCDLVIGSRNIRSGGVVGWGLGRKIISRGGSLYARTLLLTNIKDLTGGYNCYTRHALETINLPTVMSNGYVFQIEMKWRAALADLRIKEIPIIFPDRKIGQSKMSKKIFVEAMLKVLLMAFRRGRIKGMLKK
ncbi:MAG: polyprenol monophosphomannose synthase [Rickettsiales bacterium]|jgi:dolichol-phosphate mannosyltransferase|nr:polyprenol monophosphomannose synthase [Rickettsiales bacterium]